MKAKPFIFIPLNQALTTLVISPDNLLQCDLRMAIAGIRICLTHQLDGLLRTVVGTCQAVGAVTIVGDTVIAKTLALFRTNIHTRSAAYTEVSVHAQQCLTGDRIDWIA